MGNTIQAWPSDAAGRAPKVPIFHRPKRFDLDYLFGRRREPRYEPKPISGPETVTLLSDVEAAEIRKLARELPSADWLDANQAPIRVELPSSVVTEYRVVSYHWDGIPERDERGERTGYMLEQEVTVQVLVARQIRNNRVIAEVEIDWEEVPLWHFTDRGALGESFWRSSFAEHIR